MKRIVLIILALFLFLTNLDAFAAPKVNEKEIVTVAKDGFTIKSTLTYPKAKNQKDFPTVVLLHSLGYNSQWWGDLQANLLEKGYAVLAIDLRGHGKSIYNSKLSKTSWKSMKNSGYAKYPEDIISVINTVNEENTKRAFFNNWALVGADIGASAGVIASDYLPVKPKTIVMISPVVKTKGLYIPVNLAHLDNVDILSISGTDDTDSKEAAKYLQKFAQAQFLEFTSESKTTGMLMLKNDKGLSKMISEWISEYLN
jgi:pimeloyl-ACP methyl ester carboxylesterase